jgi:hypothetical protein
MMFHFKSFMQLPYASPLLAVVALIAAGAVSSIFPGPLGALALLIVVLTVGYLALRWSLRSAIALFDRSWGIATQNALSVVIVLFLFLPALGSGDYVHLFLVYPYYAYVIQSNHDTPPRRLTFDWGDDALFVTDGYHGRILVYDETDAIEAYIESLGSHASARHMIGHFYLIYDER